jgi:predicted DNA-binding transcriptional regulator AlpA
MRQDNEFEAVCSVHEMADKLGLSRPRFYQLLRLDVFPPPIYCPIQNARFTRWNYRMSVFAYARLESV